MISTRDYTTWCWSRPELKGCIVCAKNERKHHARGICQPCSWKIKANKLKERRRRNKELDDYIKNKNALNARNRRKKDPVYAEKERINCRKWYLKHREYRKKYYEKYYYDRHEYHLDRHREKKFGGLYKKVAERDNYKCVICQKELVFGRKTNLHHLDHNIKNNIMENLVLVCSYCHHTVFHKYIYIKNRKRGK